MKNARLRKEGGRWKERERGGGRRRLSKRPKQRGATVRACVRARVARNKCDLCAICFSSLCPLTALGGAKASPNSELVLASARCRRSPARPMNKNKNKRNREEG
jgi:ferredoxin